MLSQYAHCSRHRRFHPRRFPLPTPKPCLVALRLLCVCRYSLLPCKSPPPISSQTSLDTPHAVWFAHQDGVGANKENTWPPGQENERLLTACASSEQLYSHTLSDYSEKRRPEVWMAAKRKAGESDECFAELHTTKHRATATPPLEHGAANIAARTELLDADMRPRSILKPLPPPEELGELQSEGPRKRRRKKDSRGIGGTDRLFMQAGTLIKPLSPHSKQEWEKNLAQVFAGALFMKSGCAGAC